MTTQPHRSLGDEPTEDAERSRLDIVRERVMGLLLRAHGDWVDLQEVAHGGEGTATLTARARELRMDKYGGFTVETRRRPGGGMHDYRIPWKDGAPMREKRTTVRGGARDAQLPIKVITDGIEMLAQLQLSDTEFAKLQPLYVWLQQLVK